MSMCLLLFQDRACMSEFSTYIRGHSIPILTAFRIEEERWEILVYKDDYEQYLASVDWQEVQTCSPSRIVLHED